jgi:hypothetical protein
MSTIKSSDEHLTLNADGSSKDIKFQANGVEKASISSAGAFTSTTIDATKLTGNLPAISGASLTSLPVQKVNSNLIINGNFDVSQRGVYTSNTTTAGGNYYVDRWSGSTVSTLLHTKNTIISGITSWVNTLKMTVPSGQSAAALTQQVEWIDQLKGVQVTLSCWMKSNIASSINIYDGSSQTHSSAHTGGGGWEKLTVTKTLSASASQVRAEAYTGGSVAVGSYHETTQWKMEVGSTATDFEHRSYGEELALCERYYHRLGGRQYQSVAAGKINNATDCNVIAHFPQTMRAIPSIIIGTLSDWVQDTPSGTKSFTSISNYLGVSGGTLNTVGSSGMTSGQATTLRVNADNSYIGLDSEL